MTFVAIYFSIELLSIGFDIYVISWFSAKYLIIYCFCFCPLFFLNTYIDVPPWFYNYHVEFEINNVFIHLIVFVLSHIWLYVTPSTVGHQAPLSIGFSRQEYWRGLLFPPPGIFLMQGQTCFSCTADGFFTPEPTRSWPLPYSLLL